MAMKITKVTLTNVCCFEHLVLNLMRSDESPRPWTLLLGDNGVGKTTLLRSIALALCDENSASALSAELYSDLVREEAGEAGEAGKAVIEVHLRRDGKIAGEFTVTTTIERLKSGDTRIHQDTVPSDHSTFPWGEVFVCGYGIGRLAFGDKALPEFSATDALLPLFNYETKLQSMELMLRRIKDSGKINIDELLDRICDILGLRHGSIKLTLQGIEMTGEWGRFLPIGYVPDGYAATMAWICDMFAWALYFDPNSVAEPDGIVLLDEIEQHLHPRLQKEVIGRLWKQYPRIQFIATSHSPLCAVGTTDLSDEDCGLALLSWDEHHIVCRESSPPRGQRADQVLTSYLFGLATSGDRETREQIQRYALLLSQETLDSGQEDVLEKLRSALDAKLGSSESALEGRVREAVKETLERKGALSDSTKPAVLLEVARQLREILGEK
jgi:energy-coupling factor transporter ATP-binding protein EcfA2